MFLVKSFFLMFLVIGSLLNNNPDAMYQIDKSEMEIINQFTKEVQMDANDKKDILDMKIQMENIEDEIIVNVNDNEIELFELLDTKYNYSVSEATSNTNTIVSFLEHLMKILETDGFTTIEKFYFDKISAPLNKILEDSYK